MNLKTNRNILDFKIFFKTLEIYVNPQQPHVLESKDVDEGAR